MALPSEPRRKFPDYVAPTKVHYDGAHPKAIQVRTCRLITNLGGIRREHVFDKGSVRIGAMDDNDLVITDETVSRYHCRIVQEEGGYLLCDLGSTNGTFVGGVRVREAYLNSGTTIGLGQSEVQFFSSQEKVEIVPSQKNHLGDIIGNNGGPLMIRRLATGIFGTRKQRNASGPDVDRLVPCLGTQRGAPRVGGCKRPA